LTQDLKAIGTDFYQYRQDIVASNTALIDQNADMLTWWEKQYELINKQMLMMAAMGFELDLD
jgi:hypothetical protein